ncbi:MAG: alpha/beta hydrolase [Halanaerobium sp.]
MALLEMNLFSDSLGMASEVNIILPEIIKKTVKADVKEEKREFKDKYPVLYLLHGLSDDQTGWLRRSSIERYAEEAGLAVIMPGVHRSFYTDMVKGQNYFTYLSEELPQKLGKILPLGNKREETFVAGLSMGGYGAFKLALNQPERFAAAASLSGALNMAEHVTDKNEAGELYEEFKWIFGDLEKVKNSKNDLFYLLKKLKGKQAKIPELYQCCGTEDFLYQDNLKFRTFCRKNNIKLKYEEEKAAHEWWYWDKKIQTVIDWLPLSKRK